ncbi:MAG: hypothetical protein V4574_03440 [Pseudomonadota bacterium]
MFHLFVWSLICMIAATPVGALVGVMIAFVVMIFATVLTLKGALMLFGAAGALFAIGATLFGIFGWVRAIKGDWHGAMACWSSTIALTGLPLAIWLAAHAKAGWFA